MHVDNDSRCTPSAIYHRQISIEYIRSTWKVNVAIAVTKLRISPNRTQTNICHEKRALGLISFDSIRSTLFAGVCNVKRVRHMHSKMERKNAYLFFRATMNAIEVHAHDDKSI